MPTIDADTHVIETERTWDFLGDDERALRPSALVATEPQTQARWREFWRIGDRVVPRRFFEVERTGATVETQELRSIEARLAHMDQLGVDVQVLYPTLFLQPFTTEPLVEAALYRTYNRWMADIWSKGGGRLRWAVLAPTMTMDLALREIAWARDNGACAIFLRGPESERLLSNPYFFPLYEAASGLDLPICIHSGNGSWSIQDLYGADSALLGRAKLSTLAAVHDIILSGLPARFPALRFGVIETSASWVPYFCRDLTTRFTRMYDRRVEGREILAENRIFVACQTDDDLPYVLQYTGEDRLVIGSDYGHADTSSELEALRHLKTGGTIPSRAIDKILDDNARALYAL
jgi:predicted TIM-barrel fold metal-dependent hydrolase